MKLNKKEDVILSNIETIESHDFEVGDISVIMELLSKLYSRPIQTLTQEYISNARDAHRSIGQTKAIEITAPTMMNPILKIRDFGAGLSPEGMVNVFRKFGVSTKRHDNSTTGGFGIGAKSAWAYTDSFLVTSFNGGRKRVYKCEKLSHTGRMELLYDEKTNEQSGLMIEIAVATKDCAEFQGAITRCIQYWKNTERPMLKNVNIEYPKLEKVSDKIYIDKSKVNRYRNNNHCMIVDGIPYPVSNSLSEKSLWKKLKELFNCDTYIFFDTGEVDIAPTREELLDSTENAAKINAVLKTELQAINDKITNKLKEGKTFRQKIDILADLVSKYSIPNKLGRYEIDRKFLKSDLFCLNNRLPKQGEMSIVKYFLNENDLLKTRQESIYIDNIDKFFYVDIEEGAVKTCSRYRKYLTDNPGNAIFIITRNVNEVVNDLNLKGISTLPLPDKKEKTVIKNKNVKIFGHWQTKGRYNVKDWIKVDDIKETYYYYDRLSSDYNDFIWTNMDYYNFVGLAPDHIKKIKGNDNFKPIQELIDNFQFKDEHYNKVISDLLNLNAQLNCFFGKFNSTLLSHVKNPNFKKMAELKEKYSKANKVNIICGQLADKISNDKKVKEVKDFIESFENKIKQDYSLLYCLNYNEYQFQKKYKQSIIDYLNK